MLGRTEEDYANMTEVAGLAGISTCYISITIQIIYQSLSSRCILISVSRPYRFLYISGAQPLVSHAPIKQQLFSL